MAVYTEVSDEAMLEFLDYYPDPPQMLGERVLAARRRRGFTCEELGRILGTDGPTVWCWETRGFTPRTRLARALGSFLAEVGV